MNDALMTKWLWNIENSNGLWQKIINEKYIKGEPLISVKKGRMIPIFGKKMLDLRNVFYNHCRMIVGNGKKTSFWKKHLVIHLWLPNSLVYLIWRMIKIFQSARSCLRILWPSHLGEGSWGI
jgi:hypothetical protein